VKATGLWSDALDLCADHLGNILFLAVAFAAVLFL